MNRIRISAAATLILVFLLGTSMTLEDSKLKIARLKYSGGGDWYANKTSLPNLIAFANKNLNMNLSTEEEYVEPSSAELFNYPFIHMTGHGTFVFSDRDAENMRKYLEGGGFLHIDDNYGLDPFVRPQMKKVFPDLEFVELPFTHPIYHQLYDFPNGLPKVHEHDGKPPQGFGLVHEGRVVCFYSYESDLGNGWEDAGIYDDSPAIRRKALEMGSNLLMYAFSD